jgi:hypothetical protein
MAVRFGKRYLAVTQCQPPPKVVRSQSEASNARKPAAASRAEPMDEELSSDQSGKNRSVGIAPPSDPRRKTNSVGRAKTARPSSRLIYPKTAARGNSPKQMGSENQNPQNGQHWARFDWGFGAICFGAIPVAAVFGSAPGARLPRNIKSTINPHPHATSLKQDISTWQDGGLGHFYLALTDHIPHVHDAEIKPRSSGHTVHQALDQIDGRRIVRP